MQAWLTLAGMAAVTYATRVLPITIITGLGAFALLNWLGISNNRSVSPASALQQQVTPSTSPARGSP